MGRTQGAQNRLKLPDGLDMPEEQRLELIANLILEIIAEEQLI